MATSKKKSKTTASKKRKPQPSSERLSRIGVKRLDLNTYLPEEVIVVKTPGHILYSARALLPAAKWLVDDMVRNGWLKSSVILLRRNGPVLEVVAGRQRVAACLEANVIRLANGLEPIRMQAQIFSGSAADLITAEDRENRKVTEDYLCKCERVQRLETLSLSDSDIEQRLGISHDELRRRKSYLGMSPNAQKAVEDGLLPRRGIDELVKLTDADQAKAVKAMVALAEAQGAERIKAHEAAEVVASIAEGREMRELPTRKKLLPQKKLLDDVSALETQKGRYAAALVREALRYVMGYEDAFQDDSLADAAEIRGALRIQAAKKAKGA